MTTTLERPAESAGELYYPTPVTPEEAFQAIGRLRKEARDEIDRLIRFLDDTDNHMELEPSLCGVTANAMKISGEINGDDLEGDDTPTGRSAEDEPSLGSLERHCSAYGYGRDSNGDQSLWGASSRQDLEDEHDGAEPI
ncbi:MAG: hypothetical protein WC807_21045 [Hyphomicrobium sp.]|jgi:hypothetical protein